MTGDGDRSRRRCAGRGGRLPAGARRRWAGCPHPPGVERREPSSRSSRDDRGRTAATAVSAMMARPSDPPDVSGVDQTRCRGPEHRSRAMCSGPTRSGICRVGPDRTRRASARGARRQPFAIWCRLRPAGARSHGEQSSPADGPGWSRLVLVRPAPQRRNRSQPPPAPQRCQAGRRWHPNRSSPSGTPAERSTTTSTAAASTCSAAPQ